jgi:hypothetical protein
MFLTFHDLWKIKITTTPTTASIALAFNKFNISDVSDGKKLPIDVGNIKIAVTIAASDINIIDVKLKKNQYNNVKKKNIIIKISEISIFAFKILSVLSKNVKL